MRRLTSLLVSGLFLISCSGNEEPADDTGGSGAGAGGMAGSTSGRGGAAAGSPGAGTSGSAGSGSGSGGAAGTAGSASSSGGAGAGGLGGASAGTTAAGSGGTAGSAGSGASGAGAGGLSGAGGSLSNAGGGAGGALGGGAGGGSGGGSAGGAGAPPSSFSCNQVVGIDSTSEWFGGGFENDVDNAKWQIIYFHPGYIENWANPNDEVWSLAPTSACTQNSTNPDRVIFNVFADTADTQFTNQAAWVVGLNQAIANFKNKYPRLQRIDILTMTRAPNNNPPCNNDSGQPQRMSIVESYVDAAIAMVVGSATGSVAVTDAPDFFVTNCNQFTDGGPHFSDAGKPVVAGIYGTYYSAEP